MRKEIEENFLKAFDRYLESVATYEPVLWNKLEKRLKERVESDDIEGT